MGAPPCGLASPSKPPALPVDSLLHGIIMCTQAIIDPAERGHFKGDVAALFIAVVLLGWLTPREKIPKTTDKKD
jgi:hypothetical protein